MNAHVLQQWNQAQPNFSRHHGIAQRGVTPQYGDVEALRNRLQTMRLLVRVHHRRQQQGVQHRVIKDQPGFSLLELQKFHIKSRVVRHQHRVLGKHMERRQHLTNGRLASHHVLRDAVNGDRDGRNHSLRVNQLLETFLPQQLAIDDARRPHLDNFIAAGRVQASSFGVKHGVSQ